MLTKTEVPVADSLYRPPAPAPATKLSLLWRIMTSRQSDVLHYLSEGVYSVFMARVPFTRKRSIYVVNDPKVIKHIMVTEVDRYPKSDFVTSSLDPLLGESIFTVSGEQWKRQHRMINQVFAKLRLRVCYGEMEAAFHDYIKRLDECVGQTVNLDEEMAFVTADVIFRTMFSKPITDGDAGTIFREFTLYQESLPHMTGQVLFRTMAHQKPSVPKRGQQACREIRQIIAKIVDDRLSGKVEHDDICQIIVTCRDPETDEPFSREEMINQLAFFFLAGHETSASALTWALLCLSKDDNAAEKLRHEAETFSIGDTVPFDAISKMRFTSAVFKEALRLYPPVSFITRYATREDTIRGYDIKPDDLMVIAPWIVQRNTKFWDNPDRFDPDRFMEPRLANLNKAAWLPFGVGQRVCTGATFANAEATLILASITKRYRFTPLAAEKIKPVARLTLRPRDRLVVKVERR